MDPAFFCVRPIFSVMNLFYYFYQNIDHAFYITPKSPVLRPAAQVLNSVCALFVRLYILSR